MLHRSELQHRLHLKGCAGQQRAVACMDTGKLLASAAWCWLVQLALSTPGHTQSPDLVLHAEWYMQQDA